MTKPWLSAVVLTTFLMAGSSTSSNGPFDWMKPDAFDEIDDKMKSVNDENCVSKAASYLRLPILTQLPRFNKLLSSSTNPNRTNLLHAHNMALNRAFFYSYIMSKADRAADFAIQPGLLYYYFSAASDISANENNINGSAIMYDNNCAYANWYLSLMFNRTLPLFGPRAWRFDDDDNAGNWLNEPNKDTINIVDYGAGVQRNYTTNTYKNNQWYDLWLPDGWDYQGLDLVRKYTYTVGIKYSNQTGKFTTEGWQEKSFVGPPLTTKRETEHLPVLFTAPYYDCGRSNKWIVSAVSPIVDQLPRYNEWQHMRRHRFVATSVIDIDFRSIDINPCPLNYGNEPPNYFHNTARCKNTTTCEPLYGWGFRRGGYRCNCKPGYRYPAKQLGPWQGSEIESATFKEYQNGFDCIPVQFPQDIHKDDTSDAGRKKRDLEEQHTVKEFNLDPQARPVYFESPDRARRSLNEIRSQSNIPKQKLLFFHSVGLTEQEVGRKKRAILEHLTYPSSRDRDSTRQEVKPRYRRESAHSREKRQTVDQTNHERMIKIMNQKEGVNGDNCQTFNKDALELPGDVAYGAHKQFSPQARTALRLSHFLSNFLQNVPMYKEYGNLRGDKALHVEQIFGETLANVMGDLKIYGSGVFYDTDKFTGRDGKRRQLFGPYAYRHEQDGDESFSKFRAIDYAGFGTDYLNRSWFKNVKERWYANLFGLTKFTEKPMIRSDLQGTRLKEFEQYPLYYSAPREEDGWWSNPYFDCNGFVNDWIITYSVPFFGPSVTGLEFMGVVIVDVKLDDLDIDQCSPELSVVNAFKDTARCDLNTTYCEALPGRKFMLGGYKCECRQGYEFPFNGSSTYYDGQTMEEEYQKLQQDLPNRFENLTCRQSGTEGENNENGETNISGAEKTFLDWLVLPLAVIVTWTK